MERGTRWTARVALLISIVMFGAVMGTFEAFGMPSGIFPLAQQTTASPSPSESECEFPVPMPPFCPEESESPSATPSSSGSPSPNPSGGDGESYDSTITIDYRADRNRFKGVVRSNDRCEPGRRVVVRKVKEGPDPIVGRDTTSDAGRWAVREDNARGRYYAKVLKMLFMQGGTETTCRPDRSPTIRVIP